MEVEGFGNQAETDHQQKAQAQHYNGWVFIDKFSERLTGHNHQHHGNGHGRHRHHDVFHHRHGGNHAVDGEHGVQHQNLRNNGPKGGVFFMLVGHLKMVGTFQPFVQLGGGFVEQENAAAEHNQIFARNVLLPDLEQRLGQRDDFRHKGQHDEANQHGQRQTGDSGAVAQGGFDFVCQNRHKNQVVDAQHDFQNQQGDQANPGLRLGKPTNVHNVLFLRIWEKQPSPSNESAGCFENVQRWWAVLYFFSKRANIQLNPIDKIR